MPAVRVGRRLGLRTVVLDFDPDAPGFAVADRPYVVDISDPDACLAIARRERVSGVVHICSEVSIGVMGRINEELGLAGVDVATAVRATNKERMRRAFEAGGAPSPRSLAARTEYEALDAARSLGGPLIVKPARSSGSRGVTRVENPTDATGVAAAFRTALSFSRDGGAVMEEFVDGREFSLELLVWKDRVHVVAITDKETTGAPHFVESGHSQPAAIDEATRTQLVNSAVAGVRALGIRWAAAHAEVKLSTRGPFLMEIGARLGGDYITTELVPRSTGVDMVEGAIMLALGRSPDLRPRAHAGAAAIRYLIPPPGRMVRIENVETVRRFPGVVEVSLDVNTGDLASECTSSLGRSGHVITQADTAAEAIAIAERAISTLGIST